MRIFASWKLLLFVSTLIFLFAIGRSVQSQEIPSNLKHLYETSVRVKTETGYGSGWILSDYRIVTAGHVAKKVGNIVDIEFTEGRHRRGVVMDIDVKLDIAIIGTAVPEHMDKAKVNCGPLVWNDPIQIVGFPVYTMWTIVNGYVTSINKIIHPQADGNETVIDATISPGISGAPVFNSAQEVIGLATASINAPGTNSPSGLGIMLAANKFCKFLGLAKNA